MYCVYVLKSKINNSYYVGSCEDIIKRITLHNKGLVKSTKRYSPWELVYKEEFSSLKEARQRELQIKSWKKRVAVENLIKSRIRDNFGGLVV
ncbi:MAG: GIY-YIG nuclease family protein [Candidatus Nealsonbacteria bacterium]